MSSILKVNWDSDLPIYNIYQSDPERFKAFLNTQNLIRDIDQLYLINSAALLDVFKY